MIEKCHLLLHPMLTIAIPTFNRSKFVSSNLKELLRDELDADLNILISDNGSSDDTYERLIEISEGNDSVRINKMASNQLFLGNIRWLIENCESEYIVFCSDEDQVRGVELGRLKQLLVTDRPDIAILGYDTGSRVMRTDNEKLDLKSINSLSRYITGIVYKTLEAKNALKILGRLDTSNEFWSLYPQILVSGLILSCGGSGINPSIVFAVHRFQDESDPECSGSFEFWTVDSRLNQYKSLSDVFRLIRKELPDQSLKSVDILEKQLKSLLQGLIMSELSQAMGSTVYYMVIRYLPGFILRKVRDSFTRRIAFITE